MDNCAIHDKAALRELASAGGFDCLFLPPYCPVYNPIENMFGAYKTWMRGNADIVCRLDAYDAIKLALQSITPAQCESWVRRVPFYDLD